MRYLPTALTPLRNKTFAVMWLASLISNIGTWMHSVGASWMMTELSASPLMVSFVQTATTLPVFLCALPAGALADIYKRRTLLLLSNVMMFAAALLFALIVWQERATSTLLLAFTFVLGIGAAFMAPSWQAVIPRMVNKEELPQAVALGGININISRAIGPALAGVFISVYGMASPFTANAISFAVIVSALLWWKDGSLQESSSLPPERIWQGVRTGFRYALHSVPLRQTMLHVFGFMFFANAYWGLLPVIARDHLAGDARFFGLIMGAIGIGAVTGAILLPSIKRRLSPNQMFATGTVITALIAATTTHLPNHEVAVFSGLAYGLGWILVLSTVNTSAQQALPDWVRARGLAVFMMVFFGGMSLGASFWGWMAGVMSIPLVMGFSSLGSLLFLAFTYRVQLQSGAVMNHTPSRHWPVPALSEVAKASPEGPVMVSIRYVVDEDKREEFLSIIELRGKERLRNGASRWGVFEDVEQVGHFVEIFLEYSWTEHLRHHDRISESERAIEQNLLSTISEKPKVSHYLARNRELAV